MRFCVVGQHFPQFVKGFGLKFSSQAGIECFLPKHISLHYGSDIQPSPSNKEGNAASFRDLRDRFISRFLVIENRVLLAYIADIEKMMWNQLPLFLNAEMTAKLLGISLSSAYELMHEEGFPALRIGNRIVVPKEKFCRWVDRQTGGAR